MKLFFTLPVFLLAILPAKAQLFGSAYPFSSVNSNLKSLSLGNSNAALAGKYGDAHLNPAGIGIDNTGQIYFSTTDVALSGYFRTSGLTYKHKNAAFFISYAEMYSGEMYAMGLPAEQILTRPAVHEYYGNALFSYSFENGIKAGGGLNYKGERDPNNGYETSPSLSVDLGLQYQVSMDLNDLFVITPSAGIAINDFGKAVQYSTNWWGEDELVHLPTTLRVASGILIETKREINGLNTAGFRVLGAFSKFMADTESKSTVQSGGMTLITSEPVSPVKALWTSWDSRFWFDGQYMQEATLTDQLWLHGGVELSFLETFSFRFGRENAGEIEEHRSFTAIGVGLDLYYLDIDYTHVKFSDQDKYKNLYSYMDRAHWQFTGRVPLDGKRPDTILNFLF